jgi:CRISPR/Cas system endoribonuclease Cas6 (RAMP superfamily)
VPASSFCLKQRAIRLGRRILQVPQKLKADLIEQADFLVHQQKRENNTLNFIQNLKIGARLGLGFGFVLLLDIEKLMSDADMRLIAAPTH